MEPGARRGRALGVAAGGTLLGMTAFTAPLSSVPAIAADLGAGAEATSWILSSMSLGLAVSLLTAGTTGDEIGRRRLFVLGAVLLAAGSAACAAAPNAGVFIAGRIGQGIGTAAVIACGLALISRAFPAGPERTRATGIWGACMGAGPAVGPLLGSVGELVASWRYGYLLLTVLAVALAAAGRSWLAESRSGRDRGVDAIGAVLLGIGLAGLLAALTEARRGWGPLVASLTGAAAVFLVVFAAHQRRSGTTLLDWGLFRRPALVSATLAAFVTGAGIIALMSFVSTVLERATARSAVAAAVLLLAWSATSVVAALLARRLPVGLSGGTRMAAGLVGIAAGLGPLTRLAPASPTGLIAGGLVVAGVGTGLLNATLGREAVAHVPATSAGAGSGINNTSRYVGAAVGVTVVSVLALPPGGDQTGDPSAALIAGWNLAAALGVALSLAGALVIAALQRADQRRTGSPISSGAA